jgi:hypothetical protein
MKYKFAIRFDTCASAFPYIITSKGMIDYLVLQKYV